jgi:hypothetical protein
MERLPGRLLLHRVKRHALRRVERYQVPETLGSETSGIHRETEAIEVSSPHTEKYPPRHPQGCPGVSVLSQYRQGATDKSKKE